MMKPVDLNQLAIDFCRNKPAESPRAMGAADVLGVGREVADRVFKALMQRGSEADIREAADRSVSCSNEHFAEEFEDWKKSHRDERPPNYCELLVRVAGASQRGGCFI